MRRVLQVSHLPRSYEFSPKTLTAMRRTAEKASRISNTHLDAWKHIASALTKGNGDDSHKDQFYEVFESKRMSLEHELCQEMWVRFGLKPYGETKTDMEIANFDPCARLLRDAVLGNSSSFERFREAICQTASILRGELTEIRSGPVYSLSGHDDFWEYPTHTVIESQLHLLFNILVRRSDAGLHRSMVALVAITALHPFDDGNGRVSRVLFNALLDGVSSKNYIPIKEIQYASRGGYIIKLRQAWIQKNWNPMAEFLCTSIELAELVSNRQALKRLPHASMLHCQD